MADRGALSSCENLTAMVCSTGAAAELLVVVAVSSVLRRRCVWMPRW